MIATLLASKFTIPVAVFLGGMAMFYGAYHMGETAQKNKDSAAAIDMINKRNKIDGQVQDYDAAKLCASFDLKWVQDHCE
jgi:hypothetical protein